MRDDFTEKQKHILARRCGYICSNPDCRVHTSGPNTDPEKATLIGEAAHITAAAEGGPRYNSNLTPEERASLNNAIWLCSNCAAWIDKDVIAYPEELLREWKTEAESLMVVMLGKPRLISSRKQKRPLIEGNLKPNGKLRMRMMDRMSSKNHFYEENGHIIMDGGANPIYYWKITWNYNLVLQNSSSAYAFNLRFHHLSKTGFTVLPNFPVPNIFSPFQIIEFPLEYTQIIEATGIEAMDVFDQVFPDKLDGMILQIRYKNEMNASFQTLIEMRGKELINTV